MNGGWFRNVFNGIVNAAEDWSNTFAPPGGEAPHGNQGRPAGGGGRNRGNGGGGGGRSYPGQRRAAPAPTPAPRPQHVPPASQKATRQLPAIRVAPEDLVEPSNRECCICLEE